MDTIANIGEERRERFRHEQRVNFLRVRKPETLAEFDELEEAPERETTPCAK